MSRGVLWRPRRRDLRLVEYWRFYMRLHKTMGANFRENLSHAPALSGRNLPGKKIEQFSDPPGRSAAVETLDDQRVRRRARQTIFPESVTFTHRVDDSRLIVRANHPGASGPPQQGRHGAFRGQR